MKNERIYEVETNRNGLSARAFWNHCGRFLKAHGIESGTDIICDSFDFWANPASVNSECDSRNKYEGEDGKTYYEICRLKPFDLHLFYEGAYNFILEWFDGHGYMYVTEWKTD